MKNSAASRFGQQAQRQAQTRQAATSPAAKPKGRSVLAVLLTPRGRVKGDSTLPPFGAWSPNDSTLATTELNTNPVNQLMSLFDALGSDEAENGIVHDLRKASFASIALRSTVADSQALLITYKLDMPRVQATSQFTSYLRKALATSPLTDTMSVEQTLSRFGIHAAYAVEENKVSGLVSLIENRAKFLNDNNSVKQTSNPNGTIELLSDDTEMFPIDLEGCDCLIHGDASTFIAYNPNSKVYTLFNPHYSKAEATDMQEVKPTQVDEAVEFEAEETTQDPIQLLALDGETLSNHEMISAIVAYMDVTEEEGQAMYGNMDEDTLLTRFKKISEIWQKEQAAEAPEVEDAGEDAGEAVSDETDEIEDAEYEPVDEDDDGEGTVTLAEILDYYAPSMVVAAVVDQIEVSDVFEAAYEQLSMNLDDDDEAGADELAEIERQFADASDEQQQAHIVDLFGNREIFPADQLALLLMELDLDFTQFSESLAQLVEESEEGDDEFEDADEDIVEDFDSTEESEDDGEFDEDESPTTALTEMLNGEDDEDEDLEDAEEPEDLPELDSASFIKGKTTSSLGHQLVKLKTSQVLVVNFVLADEESYQNISGDYSDVDGVNYLYPFNRSKNRSIGSMFDPVLSAIDAMDEVSDANFLIDVAQFDIMDIAASMEDRLSTAIQNALYFDNDRVAEGEDPDEVGPLPGDFLEDEEILDDDAFISGELADLEDDQVETDLDKDEITFSDLYNGTTVVTPIDMGEGSCELVNATVLNFAVPGFWPIDESRVAELTTAAINSIEARIAPQCEFNVYVGITVNSADLVCNSRINLAVAELRSREGTQLMPYTRSEADSIAEYGSDLEAIEMSLATLGNRNLPLDLLMSGAADETFSLGGDMTILVPCFDDSETSNEDEDEIE